VLITYLWERIRINRIRCISLEISSIKREIEFSASANEVDFAEANVAEHSQALVVTSLISISIGNN